jgi:hypothetical protein
MEGGAAPGLVGQASRLFASRIAATRYGGDGPRGWSALKESGAAVDNSKVRDMLKQPTTPLE